MARPECEVPGCTDLVWGSEPVCRQHLLTGVTAEKVEHRRKLQEAALAVAAGDVPTKADLVEMAAEAGVDVPKSTTAKKLAAAVKPVAAELAATPDPADVDPDAMRAAQVVGIPDSNTPTKEP